MLLADELKKMGDAMDRKMRLVDWLKYVSQGAFDPNSINTHKKYKTFFECLLAVRAEYGVGSGLPIIRFLTGEPIQTQEVGPVAPSINAARYRCSETQSDIEEKEKLLEEMCKEKNFKRAASLQDELQHLKATLVSTEREADMFDKQQDIIQSTSQLQPRAPKCDASPRDSLDSSTRDFFLDITRDMQEGQRSTNKALECLTKQMESMATQMEKTNDNFTNLMTYVLSNEFDSDGTLKKRSHGDPDGKQRHGDGGSAIKKKKTECDENKTSCMVAHVPEGRETDTEVPDDEPGESEVLNDDDEDVTSHSADDKKNNANTNEAEGTQF